MIFRVYLKIKVKHKTITIWNIKFDGFCAFTVVSPPKSPLPEEGSLSRTSSVELLNPEHYEEKTEVIDGEFVDNYLSSLPIPPPGSNSVLKNLKK